MQLQIITPEKVLFSAAIDMVVVPGTLGDFGVLPGHAPFISTIRPGIIVIDVEGGTQRKMAIMSGIAEVLPERCIILAETALDCNDVTSIYVQARLNEARAALEESADEQARSDAEKKMAFAEAIKFLVGETIFE